ncbi:MAG: glycoside hydrolase family 25 protein [Oscillospiraceae bacterium]|nr:glycoside hydrolase family 25 protein [Oscillospiraceae bacterium]
MFIIIIVLLLAAVVLLVINRARLKASYDELSAEFSALSGQEGVISAPDGGKLISLPELQTWAHEASSLTDMMSRLFPEYMVYTDLSGEIVYRELDPALALNSIDRDGFSAVEGTSFKTYTMPDGSEALAGIDVSVFQGDIDWAAVRAAGIDFAIIRAGLRGYESGTVFEDENLETNLKGATEAGMPIGVYFYSQAATEAEAVEEAEFVLERIEGYEISWPVVFDMEEVNSSTSRTLALSAAQKTDIAIAFCERVKQAGYTPMIYGNMRWFAENMELDRLEDYDKWFAQYFSRPHYPYEYTIWQYTHTGAVDGISGNVDLNIAFFDYSA